MTSFSLFKYLDAFELDVNVVNFVYYGKTRMNTKIATDGCAFSTKVQGILLFLKASKIYMRYQNI